MPAVYEREPEAVRGHPLRRRKKEEPAGEHLGCNSIDILVPKPVTTDVCTFETCLNL